LWEEPEEMDEELFLGTGRPLAQLAFSVEPAAVDLAGLARLGPPPPALQDLQKRLGPGIRSAARAALVLAGSGDSPSQGRAAMGDESIRDRVTDFILSRPEGATMLLLGSRLPDSKEALHRVVHGMKREGLLTSTGSGAATRYKLAQPSTVRNAGRRQARSKTTGKGLAPRGGEAVGVSAPALGEREPAADAPLAERITAMLAAAGEPLPMREIALRLHCPVDGELRKALATLRRKGIVVMIGRRRGARYTVGDSA
jgi:hypothetical protein